MTREELRLKILGKYRRIEDYANDLGYGRQQVSNIIRNENLGGLRFWEMTRQKLGLTYQEIWECILCWEPKKERKKYGNKKRDNRIG